MSLNLKEVNFKINFHTSPKIDETRGHCSKKDPFYEPFCRVMFQHCVFPFQSEIEKRNGLPLAPFMDRERVTKSSSQIGFIRFVLLPLYEAINQVVK